VPNTVNTKLAAVKRMRWEARFVAPTRISGDKREGTMTKRGAIDVHHHLLPDFYIEAVSASAIGAATLRGIPPKWSVEASLARMDESQIERAITSFSAPGVRLSDPNREAYLATRCNEYAAGLKSAHPGRFGLFGALPARSIDSSLREIHYLYDTLGADGICLMTNYEGVYLGDARFEPLWAELDRRQSVVFVHPALTQPRVVQEHIPGAMLEFPFDTTRTIVSLLVSGVVERFPGIKFIFSHAGGVLPYLMARITSIFSMNAELTEERLGASVKKMYFDLAQSANATAFYGLKKIVPIENILFGSDYPFGKASIVGDTMASIRALDCDNADRERILSNNARGLFG
jgi:6-methylsalicylate decarboxylase